MPREPNDQEPTTKLHNKMGRLDLGMQRVGEVGSSPPADPDDQKPAEYAIDRIVEHSCTGN